MYSRPLSKRKHCMNLEYNLANAPILPPPTWKGKKKIRKSWDKLPISKNLVPLNNLVFVSKGTSIVQTVPERPTLQHPITAQL